MDKTKIENKAIKPSETKEIFSFPEFGESIEAGSQEEARKLLKEKQKETK